MVFAQDGEQLIQGVRNVHLMVGTASIEPAANPDGSESVTIRADNDVLPYLDLKVSGRQLVLGFKAESFPFLSRFISRFRWKKKSIHFTIRIKQLDEIVVSGSAVCSAESFRTTVCRLRASGSATIQVDTIEAQALDIRVDGRARVQVENAVVQDLLSHSGGAGEVLIHSGSTQTLRAEVQSSGRILAVGVEAKGVDAGVRDHGNVEVHAVDSLRVRIDGTGSVRYLGNPSVARQVSGGGTVSSF